MKKSICFYFIIFLIAFCSFACIFPYPILSRYTNSTEKQMSKSNQFHESEISKFDIQKNIILTLSWDEGLENLLENDTTYEIYDFATKQTFKVKRIGGINHADIIPETQEDFSFINQNLPQDACTPVALLYSSSVIIPASFNGCMHGYSDNANQFYGHYCLHFNGSKTHETNNIDYYHRKAIKSAERQAKSLLID